VIEHMHAAGGYTPEDFRRVESAISNNSTGNSGPSTLAVESTSPAMETEENDAEDTWREADFLPPGN
jgi:hypothetical protein